MSNNDGEQFPAGGTARADRPVEILQRWQDSGAVWRVVSRTASGLSIALMTCDGGEVVERLTSNDPDLLAFVGERSSSEL